MKVDEYNPNDPEFRISRYVDGDLDEANRRALEGRLAEDPAAQATRQAYESLGRRLQSLGCGELDWDRFAGEVQRRCLAERLRMRQARVLRWTGSLAAAAALVGMLTLWTITNRTPAAPEVVAEIAVGPRSAATLGPRVNPPMEFRFSHAGGSVELVEVQPEPDGPGPSLIVACVQPMLVGSSGRNGSDVPF